MPATYVDARARRFRTRVRFPAPPPLLAAGSRATAPLIASPVLRKASVQSRSIPGASTSERCGATLDCAAHRPSMDTEQHRVAHLDASGPLARARALQLDAPSPHRLGCGALARQPAMIVVSMLNIARHATLVTGAAAARARGLRFQSTAAPRRGRRCFSSARTTASAASTRRSNRRWTPPSPVTGSWWRPATTTRPTTWITRRRRRWPAPGRFGGVLITKARHARPRDGSQHHHRRRRQARLLHARATPAPEYQSYGSPDSKGDPIGRNGIVAYQANGV